MGTGDFYVDRSDNLLHSRYSLVYDCVCTQYRSGWRVDGTSMVCGSVYHTGYCKIRTGAMDQSAVRKDNRINVRRRFYGLRI